MNLTFANFHFFWLLAILPVLVGLKLIMDARGRFLLKRAVASQLVPRLVVRSAPWRGWLILSCELSAVILLITTLARPQLGHVEEEIFTNGRSILLALDTSRSMLAIDMKPNRITRTKLVITDLIKKLKSDRIGLIAFAGKPFLQAPITEDHDALLETLDQCDTEIIPRGGSNLAEAIDLAIDAFKGRNLPEGKTIESLSPEEKSLIERAQASSQALLLFSDGEELEGDALDAAKRAAEANIAIITIGVGTAKGEIIPDPDSRQGQYLMDAKGVIITSKLQEEVLQEIARVSHGLYLPLASLIQDNRLDILLSKLDFSTNKNKTVKKAVERFQWPLGASMLLLIASVLVRTLPNHSVPSDTTSRQPDLQPESRPLSGQPTPRNAV